MSINLMNISVYADLRGFPNRSPRRNLIVHRRIFTKFLNYLGNKVELYSIYIAWYGRLSIFVLEAYFNQIVLVGITRIDNIISKIVDIYFYQFID